MSARTSIFDSAVVRFNEFLQTPCFTNAILANSDFRYIIQECLVPEEEARREARELSRLSSVAIPDHELERWVSLMWDRKRRRRH
jgi:hypothetical protein